MQRNHSRLPAVAILVLSSSSIAIATTPIPATRALSPTGAHHLEYDPPRSYGDRLGFRDASDTLWFGGRDANGLAVLGGVWDFDDGTAQGWTSIDRTDVPAYFRHVTADSCAAHGSTSCPVITADGSLGSVWCGAHQDEALDLCWPGGQGYGRSWSQFMAKTFEYAGSGDVTLEFDYFTETVDFFDFVYVYVIDTDGVQHGPLNGDGYTGVIGSAAVPATETILISGALLPPASAEFEIAFEFLSSPLGADDSFAGFIDIFTGPFGVDNVRVESPGFLDVSDFEPTGTPGEEIDGWSFAPAPAVGSFLAVQHLTDLDPVEPVCTCPLADYVMVAADTGSPPETFPHPDRQHEQLVSNPVAVGPGTPGHGRTDRVLQWSSYEDTPIGNGVFYRFAFDYYPWTCPETGVAGWTLTPAGDGGFVFSGLGGPRCVTFVNSLAEFLPQDVDSIRAVFEIIGDCDVFGIPPETCTGPEQTNHSPYWDDIRIGLVNVPNAPAIALDLAYQDAYPAQNTLVGNAPAKVHSFYDLHRADGDPTNAMLGDSAVVTVAPIPNSEVYLNFRVYPGPILDDADPWFTRYGTTSIAPGWARARMDTAEASAVQPGFAATYVHEDDPAFQPPELIGGAPNPANKILPDDLFTPGTTIEYFFTSRFTGSEEVCLVPDTTAGVFLEFEVLPGYFRDQADLVAPCFLYVDAFNAGAQPLIEDEGLRPYLGTAQDDDGRVHDIWDRYDYLAAGTNLPAPFAREPGGDNGITRYQSLLYRTILYNTGTRSQEGLRDGDADLLQDWMVIDDLGRYDIRKGLWLSGDGIPTILDNPSRPNSQNLLVNFGGAIPLFGGTSIRDATGDSSLCVRLDAAAARDFPPGGASYGSLRGNGCPALLSFRIVGALGGTGGAGNLVYVDQDAGEAITAFASISNDQFAPGNPANYGVLVDAFSLHHLRATPDGWTGEDCGTDPGAITRRVADVLDWFGSAESLCLPSGVITDTPGSASSPVARTRLLPNSPNPFNPRTTIRYRIAERTHVTLEVFDSGGRRIRRLVDGVQLPDSYAITWDGATDTGAHVASGVYWAQLRTSAGQIGSTKMVVLK